MSEHAISDETIMKNLRNVIAVFAIFTVFLAVTVAVFTS